MSNTCNKSNPTQAVADALAESGEVFEHISEDPNTNILEKGMHAAAAAVGGMGLTIGIPFTAAYEGVTEVACNLYHGLGVAAENAATTQTPNKRGR